MTDNKERVVRSAVTAPVSRNFESSDFPDDDIPQQRQRPPLRNFTVPDESAQQTRQMSVDEALAFRQEKIQEAQKSFQAESRNVRKRVDALLGITRAHKDIPIETEDGEIIFSVRTFKGAETRQFIRKTHQVTQDKRPDAVFILRTYQLTLAVVAIDGVSIEDILEIRQLSDEEKFESKFLFIDEFDDAVLTKLQAEFEKLQKEHFGKYNIKTEAEAKEAASAISKSS